MVTLPPQWVRTLQAQAGKPLIAVAVSNSDECKLVLSPIFGATGVSCVVAVTPVAANPINATDAVAVGLGGSPNV